MPIYEYECASCHHQFDLMQKISDAPAKQCPRCLENTAVRLVSAAGFQLKGTGWYATDFKNKGKQENKKDTVVSDNTAKPASEEKKTTDPKSSTTSTKGDKD